MLSASWLTPRLMTSKKPLLSSSAMRRCRSPGQYRGQHALHLAFHCTSGVRSVHSKTVPTRSPLSAITGFATRRKVRLPSETCCGMRAMQPGERAPLLRGVLEEHVDARAAYARRIE